LNEFLSKRYIKDKCDYDNYLNYDKGVLIVEKYRLDWEKLNHFCSTDSFNFDTTAELEPLEGIIGQDRAAKALSFGLHMNKKGYNIYISGVSGTGRSSYSQSIVEEFAEKKSPPSDWVYVYNFKNPDKPKALGMEAGVGKQFKKDMEDMIEQIRKEIISAFRSTEYETNKNELVKEYQQKNQEMVKSLNEKAKEYGFMFKETEHGLMTIPLVEERPMTQDEYEDLDVEEIDDIREKSNSLSLETFELFNEIRELEAKLRDSVKNSMKKQVITSSSITSKNCSAAIITEKKSVIILMNLKGISSRISNDSEKRMKVRKKFLPCSCAAQMKIISKPAIKSTCSSITAKPKSADHQRTESDFL
jgi:hypothetical protein